MPAEPSAAATRAITCPGCGGSVEMRAAGITVTLVCEYCGSVLDVAHPDARLISRFAEEQAKLEIPLGTRGALRGVEWQAIGYLRRSSSGTGWEEYLLFNPYHGYRWLVAQDGKWSFGSMLTASPVTGGESIEWGGRTFRRFFDSATAQVDYVLGEFYWRVTVGEAVTTIDYARPGAMLSMEQNAQERSWTLNEWLPKAEIRAAFPGVSVRGGGTPAPHQPSPYAAMLRGLPKVGLIGAVVLCIAFFGVSAKQDLGTFEVPAVMEGSTASRSFGPVTLTGASQAVTVTSETQKVEQGWVDIDIALVDRKTQQSYEAYSVNEHYYGSDGDGPWSEGSRSQTVKVASLPAGTYDLVVDAGGHNWIGGATWDASASHYAVANERDVGVRLRVERGAAFWSNLFVALLLLLLPLIGLWFLHYRFEKARLYEMDSDAGPSDWLLGYAAP